MTAPLVVEVVRSGVIESEHLYDVVVLDGDGALVAVAGDPDRVAAFRSSAKPIQAEVALANGFAPPVRAMLAIACASHSGEADHVAAVRGLLEATGVPETALRCPPAAPARHADAVAAATLAPVFHNCSGKHAAMLAACIASRWPTDSYRDPEHPLQRAVTARVTEALGAPPARLLVDGCGVPTVVASLRALARAFGSIAGGAAAEAMRAEPFLVGGTDRLDTDLMRALPGVLAKGGAEGLTCVAASGYAIALKARDGASRGAGPAVLATLEMLGLVGDAASSALTAYRSPAVLGGGERVGELRARTRPERV